MAEKDDEETVLAAMSLLVDDWPCANEAPNRLTACPLALSKELYPRTTPLCSIESRQPRHQTRPVARLRGGDAFGRGPAVGHLRAARIVAPGKRIGGAAAIQPVGIARSDQRAVPLNFM